MNKLIIYSIWAKTQHYDAKKKLHSSTNYWLTHAWPLSPSVRSENNTPMVQVDKRSNLVLFKQNQRNHDPYTSELEKAYKTDYLVNRHNMMGTVSKLYVSNNTLIYVYIKNLTKFQLQFQLQLREFQLQLQLQLRQVSWISTPTPTPGVSTPTPTPTPTPASLLNINSNSNSNSGGFNSNSNSNSGVGVGVEPNSNSNSGVDPNPDWSQVLSWEWRCSWSSTDRRCSNYIWVIANFIAYKVLLILEVLP